MDTELIRKLTKFTEDPDWVLVVKMMEDHLSPLKDVMSIDPNKSNDEIASEVRGRQLSITGLTGFLRDAGIVKGKPPVTKTSFK